MLMLKSRHEEVVRAEKATSFEEGCKRGYNLANEEFDKEVSRLEESISKLKKLVSDKDKEIVALINTIENKEKRIKEVLLENEINCKKVEIQRFFLACNYRKDVARYEVIAKRTKKFRTRKKAESKIIKLKELQLAFE